MKDNTSLVPDMRGIVTTREQPAADYDKKTQAIDIARS